mmetsp:Transcript_26106/g.68526  ORF Transcript_26106/g.68526 Transcript_26106/m.68526 type:complete len:250 (-) Transcript_26106:395-1144(-)
MDWCSCVTHKLFIKANALTQDGHRRDFHFGGTCPRRIPTMSGEHQECGCSSVVHRGNLPLPNGTTGRKGAAAYFAAGPAQPSRRVVVSRPGRQLQKDGATIARDGRWRGQAGGTQHHRAEVDTGKQIPHAVPQANRQSRRHQTRRVAHHCLGSGTGVDEEHRGASVVQVADPHVCGAGRRRRRRRASHAATRPQHRRPPDPAHADPARAVVSVRGAVVDGGSRPRVVRVPLPRGAPGNGTAGSCAPSGG